MDPSVDGDKLLAARADLARSRLSATLSALDRRRREVMDLPLQAQKHAALLGVVGAACVTGILAIAVYRLAAARRRRGGERWMLAQRAWKHPEQFGQKRRSIFAELGRAAALAVGRLVVSRLLRGLEEAAGPEEHLALPAGRSE